MCRHVYQGFFFKSISVFLCTHQCRCRLILPSRFHTTLLETDSVTFWDGDWAECPHLILLWDRTCVYTLHLLHEWKKKKILFLFTSGKTECACFISPPPPFAIFNLSGWGHKCLNQKEGMSERVKTKNVKNEGHFYKNTVTSPFVLNPLIK